MSKRKASTATKTGKRAKQLFKDIAHHNYRVPARTQGGKIIRRNQESGAPTQIANIRCRMLCNGQNLNPKTHKAKARVPHKVVDLGKPWAECLFCGTRTPLVDARVSKGLKNPPLKFEVDRSKVTIRWHDCERDDDGRVVQESYRWVTPLEFRQLTEEQDRKRRIAVVALPGADFYAGG